MEGSPAGSCLPLQARERLPRRVRKDPSLRSAAGQAADGHRRVATRNPKHGAAAYRGRQGGRLLI